ncbi:MAG: glycosyltransferase [Gammaproteobacteria bacterium]
MKPIIVVSAINFRSGGPLAILQDCLNYLNLHYQGKYRIIALVCNQGLLEEMANVEFIGFPKSIHSYFFRLYYEYFYFKKLSQRLKPYLWLSLHDMTPNVDAEIRAVYCHNAAPFYSPTIREIVADPKFALFNLFYGLIYRINIKKNDYVIVQQHWLREKFVSAYDLKNVIVAHPNVPPLKIESSLPEDNIYRFVFPTLPRVFKNIEVIVDAVKLLNAEEVDRFEVIVTVDGLENRYVKRIGAQCKGIENIKLIGRRPRREVYELYEKCNCLIFPSKLETWGLPITEFKDSGKPMLVADLAYAHETVGDYERVCFFSPDSPVELSRFMHDAIHDTLNFTGGKARPGEGIVAKGWRDLFDLLLSRSK